MANFMNFVYNFVNVVNKVGNSFYDALTTSLNDILDSAGFRIAGLGLVKSIFEPILELNLLQLFTALSLIFIVLYIIKNFIPLA